MTPDDDPKTSEEEKAIGRLEIVDDGGVRDGIKVLYRAIEFWHYHATENTHVLC
ncbi:hypothetical protein PQR37_19510 [Paraburkholderia nemoris]|uniref:hypothetical protein n=1 Tax=Paraburkholderia nemoris TaxID=2793076 RepID=UPI0038B994EB